MALSTLSFSVRTLSASKEEGGSIAMTHSTCNKWFWIMSRRAPEVS